MMNGIKTLNIITIELNIAGKAYSLNVAVFILSGLVKGTYLDFLEIVNFSWFELPKDFHFLTHHRHS